ncbi:MAG TPA: DUF503 domain-containing protein [Longimicrobiales bacterium]|nr:DUF503 domain-containing protein [Longimicrobiales bacterium]
MVVGVIVWELEILGAQSLKDKRRVVSSLKERLRSRFKVSAAETRHQDLWQRAEIAVAVVGGEQYHVTDVLDSADRLVTGDMRARVISARRTYY